MELLFLELLRTELISRPPILHREDDPSGGRLFGNVGGKRFDVRVASEKGAPDFGRNLDLLKTYRVELNS